MPALEVQKALELARTDPEPPTRPGRDRETRTAHTLPLYFPQAIWRELAQDARSQLESRLASLVLRLIGDDGNFGATCVGARGKLTPTTTKARLLLCL
jgi:hypothetical protein